MKSVIAVLLGLVICLGLAAGLGENPLEVLGILFRGAFGSTTALGYTVYYATPLIFTGLAVSVAFQCGLFNIGAEGQLHMGAMGMTLLGLLIPGLPAPLSILAALLVGVAFGAAWGGLAGYFKAARGAHEVLVTIMLNFISYGIVGYFVFNLMKNPETVSPETYALSENYFIPPLPVLGSTAPANWAFLVALAIAGAVGFILKKTVWGFQVRLTGASPETAMRAGVPVSRRMVEAMALSGALAALVGLNEILGFAHKLREGFSTGYGFMGIAVALVGRNRPLGIVLAALLFGALHKGSLDLDLDTKFISRDLAVVMQGIVILFVVLDEYFFKLVKGLRRGRAP